MKCPQCGYDLERPGRDLKNLRTARESLGLTREDLANLAGVSVTTIRYLEVNPDYRARPSTIRRLAGALGSHSITTRPNRGRGGPKS